MPDDRLTLGEFRELTKELPDATLIVPHFDEPPADHEPGVTLFGFQVQPGFEFLGVTEPVVLMRVGLFYLNEDADDEEDPTICKKCGTELDPLGYCKDETCPYTDFLQSIVFNAEGSAVTICDECKCEIPDKPGGSLANKHHKPSCSLHDPDKE